MTIERSPRRRPQRAAGVDTGGTFTDVAWNTGGALAVRKVLTDPAAPEKSVLAGLACARGSGFEAGPFTLMHGTTVATNAILEGRGARAAFVTTEGFRDMLALGRQNRAELYSLSPGQRPTPIPRANCFEVRGRIGPHGEVIEPLDMAAMHRLAVRLRSRGFRVAAVCFLNSWINASHERSAGEVLAAAGIRPVLSVECAPGPPEYERGCTTAISAKITSLTGTYLARLAERASAVGAERTLVMRSDGYCLDAALVAGTPVHTALSGPAAGVIGAMSLARAAGYGDLLTFDMGGTSTDVAVVRGGRCASRSAGTIAGLPIVAPMLDIFTVGAGGGSIVFRNVGGGLQVGPESAGSVPGPVAYGRGDRLTVTDANVMLGILPADTMLAGSIPLHLDRVRDAFGRIASEIGATPSQVAHGVRDAANAAMARACRRVSAERGHDPAGLALFAYGGAAGTHACGVAALLGIRRIIVPTATGAFSAAGLLFADVGREFVHPLAAFRVRDGHASTELHRAAAALLAEARSLPPTRARAVLHWSLDSRFEGQTHAIRFFAQPTATPDEIEHAFRREYRRSYGSAENTDPVEVVAVRLRAAMPSRRRWPTAAVPASARQEGSVPADIAGNTCTVPHYHRAGVGSTPVAGPCVVTQDDATTWVAPGWTARADGFGSLVMELQ